MPRIEKKTNNKGPLKRSGNNSANEHGTPAKGGSPAASPAAAASAIGFEASDASKAAAKRELNLLASLIAPGGAPKDLENMPVLNLFPDHAASAADSKSSGNSVRVAEVITFDADDSAALRARLVQTLAIDMHAVPDQKDQDLLDLMDQGAAS